MIKDHVLSSQAEKFSDTRSRTNHITFHSTSHICPEQDDMPMTLFDIYCTWEVLVLNIGRDTTILPEVWWLSSGPPGSYIDSISMGAPSLPSKSFPIHYFTITLYRPYAQPVAVMYVYMSIVWMKAS
jgi:hypothetical protein